MKYLILIALSLSILSCGRNNQTGQSGGAGVVGPGINPVVNPIGIGNVNQQAILATVMNEYRCINGLQRFTVQFPLNMSVALNGFYVGVTSEGDVSVVSSNNGVGLFTAYICARQSVPSGQGQLLGNPVINRSFRCGVDEITAAKMTLAGTLMLNFRAIHFPPRSSLCTL